jgi:very-short-patch-repair endonuclease
MVEIEHLSRAVDAAARRPGAGRLREAMEFVRPRVESPQETALRLLIIRAGLPEPEVNVRRFAADGSYLGRPDLSYDWCRLAVEYQGDHHRTDRTTWRIDLARRERFEDAGWRVVLVSRDDLSGVESLALLTRIRRHLARAESR